MGAVKFQLYKTLGVPVESSIEDIARSYRRLALKYHPDRNPEGVEKFKSISNAYAVLSDPERRAAYDLTGFVSDSAESPHAMSDEAARQQRSVELADQVRNFFATYAGSAEEQADVVRGYEKCNGDFKKMVREYLLFDNGVEAEVQRLHRLVSTLIEVGNLSPTPAWESTSTPEAILRLEKAMHRERQEAEKVLKDMAGNGTGAAGAADGDLSSLQVMIRQRQQSSYESMLSRLENKYVTKRNNARESSKRTREAAPTARKDERASKRHRKASHHR
ncbi:J33 / DnaJ domain-containing protein / JDP33 [Leishmania donovani]|uniref:Chaperone_protein_DNAj_putative/GeneDB:LmjF.36.44 70 n=1 Tax=Leishmania donovani TaxID=5661 RepID=A0A504WZ61_LEIDO|nr:DnaJ domain family protein [Leishmania donovani]CAJ1993842.1 J33 / DnaJ domain-containing protein / JDP33 [Leishmania donovani]VDZ49663.1 chaperone_protein_DNAj_putative/GeneDB:LmjF.36.4470 [Leishmania donovani]